MKIRQVDKATLLDEELHDLKLRFELLEGDRKAYYETSQWAIRQNKEEISNLRAKNKEFREAIAKFKKYEADSQGGRVALTELEKIEQRICEIHKRYDELCADARMKEEKMRDLEDQLGHLKREAETVKTNSQDSTQAKEIRQLENRLDKAMIKYNEAQSIRKTYEQIVKRLQEERLTFDNQLTNFERTLKSKKQDAKELEMMSKDANHAKEVAKAELAKIEAQINEERKIREKNLQSKKEMVKARLQELQEKLDRKALKLNEQPELSQPTDASNNAYDEAKEKKLAEYEELMRVIKESTGVSDIQEVIAKFNAQADTHSHLTSLQKMNEKRLAELKKRKEEVTKEYEELKYSGESRHAHAKNVVAEFEKRLQEAQTKCQETKGRYERSSKLLANAKAGIQHLYDKLESIIVPGEAPQKLVMSDENIVKILQVCVQKLEILANNVQGKESLIEQQQAVATALSTGEPSSPYGINPAMLPAHNTRVKLRPVEFEVDINEDDDENDDENGEVLDRETIKKHTAQMLNARMKNKQAKKPKKKKSREEDEDNA